MRALRQSQTWTVMRIQMESVARLDDIDAHAAEAAVALRSTQAGVPA